MNLINAYSFLPIHAQLSDSIDALFSKSAAEVVDSDLVNALPRANVIEKEDVLRIDVVAPGYSKEDFEITVDEGLLTVRAKIEENIGEESSNWKRREFFNSRFTRVFRLEKYGRGGEVKAAYEKGILSIEIPKMKEKARSIEIS